MTTTHAMSHADAAWLHMDRPTNLMIVTSALWTDAPLDESRLRQVIQERLVDAYPRFRQRVVEGLTGPHWEDDPTFDLDLHMHHLALPHPGDRGALEAVVGDLMAQPLDRSRPLWEATLDRARLLPEARLHEQVDGEWSLVETQRHLLFAGDAWLGNAVLEEAAPYHPLGFPAGGMPPDAAANNKIGRVIIFPVQPTTPAISCTHSLSVRLSVSPT